MSRWFWPSTANNGASQTGLGNLFLGFGRTELIKEGQARPNSLRALLFYSPYNFPNFRYRDWDMENAHPNIMLLACEERGFQISELKKYCENRQDFLIQEGVGKKWMLELFNTDRPDWKIKNKSENVKNLAKEMCINKKKLLYQILIISAVWLILNKVSQFVFIIRIEISLLGRHHRRRRFLSLLRG